MGCQKSVRSLKRKRNLEGEMKLKRITIGRYCPLHFAFARKGKEDTTTCEKKKNKETWKKARARAMRIRDGRK